MTDAGVLEFVGTLTVKANSGNWFLRNPEHPNIEFIAVKQV